MITSTHDSRMTREEIFSVLKRHSLSDLVCGELERMIVDGRLPPGEALREMQIADSLGVSRGPVREAFRALEEKGLVTVVKNCGVYVRQLRPDEADDIFDVRRVLEAAIGARVAARIDAAGTAALGEIVGRMEAAVAAGDAPAYAAFNFEFHDTLARLSGNRRLHEDYTRLVAQLSLLRRRVHARDRGSMQASLDEHRAIVAAVTQRCPEAASELMVRHATHSRARMQQVFDARRGPASPIPGEPVPGASPSHVRLEHSN
jgi:DNA-binding GntR family transcriptional regulator